MNHETLQALYQLDVQEVGKEEAAKRWEHWHGYGWEAASHPESCHSDEYYRRKPGIPWPKVMQQKIGTCTCGYSTVLNTVHRTDGPCFKYTEPQPATQWPTNSPGWATGLERRYYCIRTGQTQTLDYIERPKPAKQKIDWANLSPVVERFWSPDMADVASGKAFPSCWIAWNCDEHTHGNPLPDGLVVKWFQGMANEHSGNVNQILWDRVTRFRIVGIQEGWE